MGTYYNPSTAPNEAIAAHNANPRRKSPVWHSSLEGLRDSMFGLNPEADPNAISALGRRDVNPLSDYNRFRGGRDPHLAPRWEYDETLGEWVESNLPEEEYADIYGAMGTKDKQKERQKQALLGLQGLL